MNPTLKRYLISSLITFLSTFLLVLGTELSVDAIDTSAIVALALTAVRAGIKAVGENLPRLK